jgi:hypothetical protein
LQAGRAAGVEKLIFYAIHFSVGSEAFAKRSQLVARVFDLLVYAPGLGLFDGFFHAAQIRRESWQFGGRQGSYLAQFGTQR